MIMIKKIFKSILEFLFLRLASASRSVAGLTHFGLYVAQWGIKPTPHWFDHNVDVYWQWPKKHDSSWLERGILNSLCLEGGDALELTCGDGFYTSRFYASKLTRVVACDRDAKAIASARKYSKASNVDYVVADILTDMPIGEFQHVIWDFGFPWCNHFSSQEIESIVHQCKTRLKPGGIFSGYLALLSQSGVRAKNEGAEDVNFKNIASLKAFLLSHFAHVSVMETISPGRHNAYFYASDDTVPFGDGWARMV